LDDTIAVTRNPGPNVDTSDGFDGLSEYSLNGSDDREAWVDQKKVVPRSFSPRSEPIPIPKFQLSHELGDIDATEEINLSPHLGNERTRSLGDFHFQPGGRAESLSLAVAELPEAGASFLGFRLVEELGRGAFGRVYLALQGDLADRPVALKISAEKPGESRTLARLQHTNIVPIFSAHSVPPLHAVCMPFFGATTLGDVFEDLQRSGKIPDSGQALLATISSHRTSFGSTDNSSWGSKLPSSPPDPSSEPSKQSEAVHRELSEAANSPERSGFSETLQLLGDLPYVEAVLSLTARLSDGLSHAHDRGIFHRDLKPANILLTDDGQPMLLDFNLSEDSKQIDEAATVSIGGTLPYMSPEHLDAFRGGQEPVDARSDLYSLGVIVFELLTGQRPFEVYQGKPLLTIARMIEDREKAPPSVRSLNPRVSPAVESIVHHLLRSEPGLRYQAAYELREDIERHLANLPLKHAPEPSLIERVRKFARRHPRLTSSTSVATFALFFLLGMGALLFQSGQRLARLEAVETLNSFRDKLGTARFLLHTKTADRDRRSQGAALGHAALKSYGVEDRPDWRKTPAFVHLDPVDQEKLREDVGELLVILARAGALDAADQPDKAGRVAKAQAAVKLCDLAEACFPNNLIPKSLKAQEADLAGILGQAAEAQRLQALAEAIPPRTARDRYLIATSLVVAGEYRKALPIAKEATRQEPQNLWAWFILAFCHDRLEQDAEAAACYGTCIALRPEFPYSWFNRGLIQLRRGDLEQSIADFDRAIALRPDWYEPTLNRGIAELSKGGFAEAIRDLSRAVELGAPETRIFFLRAVARERSGDAQGGRRDREEGLRKPPTDEPSWVSRAMARIEAEPEKALEDLDRALTLNPRSLPALQNRAHILAQLGRTEEAVKSLDSAVALYPDYVPARSGRGVLLAILGRREPAIIDAKESLWRDTSPPILYQSAGIYAMTSKLVPDDRIEAFRLLSTALRGGFGFEELEGDRELNPIRDQPEFRELLGAAKALLPKPPAVAPGQP